MISGRLRELPDSDTLVGVGGAALWLPAVSAANARCIAGAGNGLALGTLALTANRIYAIPFVLASPLTITRLAIAVSTLTSGTAYVGLYNDAVASGLHQPGTQIVVTGGLNTGSTGEKIATVTTTTLKAGVVYWAAVTGSGAATLRALAGGGVMSMLGFSINATTAISLLYVAGSGTLPSDLSGSSFTADVTAVPAIYLAL